MWGRVRWRRRWSSRRGVKLLPKVPRWIVARWRISKLWGIYDKASRVKVLIEILIWCLLYAILSPLAFKCHVVVSRLSWDSITNGDCTWMKVEYMYFVYLCMSGGEWGRYFADIPRNIGTAVVVVVGHFSITHLGPLPKVNLGFPYGLSLLAFPCMIPGIWTPWCVEYMK